MAKLPTVTSGVSATSLRSGNVLANSRATASSFGGQIGQALQGAAGGIDRLAGGLDALAEKRRKETVANAVAQSDFTRRELEIRNETPANGEGYQSRVTEEYLNFVDEQADNIEDGVARTAYKNKMLAQLPNVSSRSAQYEFTIAATHSKEQANASLMSLENKVMTDPTLYETYVQQGEDVIDTRTELNPTARAGMKAKWRQDSARGRFVGMLETAKSVDDIDAVAAELTGMGVTSVGPDDGTRAEKTDWAKEFSSGDFERMVNLIGSTREAFVTKADAGARAALDTIEDRAKDITVLLPQGELAAVQSAVRQSQNPITKARMARVTRDQDIIRESRHLTPSEIQARINATDGNPGAAYPGMPPVVSSAINTAAETFGVSASYLGGTVQKEYGQYLNVKRSGKPQFAPQSVHKGVDLRNVRPEVVDAATVAGELFGAPLNITSGHRSQAKQNAIRARGNPNRPSVAKKSHHTSGTALDITTTGMSEADKGRLVGALVDAGFTGIGEYGTHVHADLRAAVPASFGERDGKVWGGWTYLSPAVAQALSDRGFASEKSAAEIKRSSRVAVSDDIDYGRGTGVKRPDGTPATSATGIMQFTDSTFLETIKSPGIAERIGVDIASMSDADILELRKDPQVSIMAGAAFAAKNRDTLSKTLGRSVSDPEMYMAHLLGAGGAVALVKGYEAQPEQSAAKLMPNAAKNNRSVFYDKGRERTVREVYNGISVSFTADPSRVAHGDNETRQRLLDRAQKQVKDNPVGFAQETGTFTVSDISTPEGLAARGQEARAIADFYSIPASDMKPFTDDEANSLAKRMKDGSVDDVLEIMTAIEGLGGDMTRAALKQLDQKDSVYAYAAGLQFERGQGSAASDIVRGQKRLEENPDIKNSIGAEPRDVYDAFVKATGGALYEIAPQQRQSITDAALAHYIETFVARSGTTNFDQSAFETSVQSVLGGTRGAPAIAEVNGEMTVLPPGVSGEEMEQAMGRMTVEDWIKMSDQQQPPRYVTGEVIEPRDMADEARLRAIGGDRYKIVLSDGTYAVTGSVAQNGRMEAYIFTPDSKSIESIASRPQNRTGLAEDEGPVVDEQLRMLQERGPLWNYDDDGRWRGPAGSGYSTSGSF